MTHIRKKSLILLLCFTLMVIMALPASARASEYFYRTYVEVTDVGNGTLRIKVDLGATETMQELGATKVIVHEKKSNGDYEPIYTYTREETPSLVTRNRVSYVTYVTYYGSPGKSYYVLCAFYAKNATGSQIKWGGSNIEDT